MDGTLPPMNRSRSPRSGIPTRSHLITGASRARRGRPSSSKLAEMQRGRHSGGRRVSAPRSCSPNKQTRVTHHGPRGNAAGSGEQAQRPRVRVPIHPSSKTRDSGATPGLLTGARCNVAPFDMAMIGVDEPEDGHHDVRRPRTEDGGNYRDVRRNRRRKRDGGVKGVHGVDDGRRPCASSPFPGSNYPRTSPATAKPRWKAAPPMPVQAPWWTPRCISTRCTLTNEASTIVTDSLAAVARLRARLDWTRAPRSKSTSPATRGRCWSTPMLLDFGKNALALDVARDDEGRCRRDRIVEAHADRSHRFHGHGQRKPGGQRHLSSAGTSSSRSSSSPPRYTSYMQITLATTSVLSDLPDGRWFDRQARGP